MLTPSCCLWYRLFYTERAEELESKVEELGEVIAELQSTIGQQEDGAKEAISQWGARCNLLEENLSSAEDARHEAEARLAPLEEQIQRLEPLQVKVSTLEHKLNEKNESLERLHEKTMHNNYAKDMLRRLAVSNASNEEQRVITGNLRKQVEERDVAIAIAKEQTEALTKELAETREQSEEVVGQWKGKKLVRFSALS